MQPVSFDTSLVRPLPKELFGSVCSECDKPQSVWALPHATQLGQETPFVCSLCVLYESRWAQDAGESVAAFVAEVERVRGTPFDRNDAGHLARVEDADRILIAIVIENRLDAVRKARLVT